MPKQPLTQVPALQVIESNGELATILDELPPSTRHQIELAIEQSYRVGQRDADEKSAKFVARCVAALVGLPMPDQRSSPREVLGRLRTLLGTRG